MKIDPRILELNKVVHFALEPDTRRALLDELRRYHPDIEQLHSFETAVRLAKWMRQYIDWLPEVPMCPICKRPMEQGMYTKKAVQTFKPNQQSWTGYEQVQSDNLCEKVERWACRTCFHVECHGRENDVRVLMRTRRGRCGEVSIMYVSFLLALGYQARLVVDPPDDHVWAEVRIGDRWRPLDPSAVDDVQRLDKDPYLFERWGWTLREVLALEPGKQPVEIGREYRKVQVP